MFILSSLQRLFNEKFQELTLHEYFRRDVVLLSNNEISLLYLPVLTLKNLLTKFAGNKYYLQTLFTRKKKFRKQITGTK